jgi:hypothetical protein
VHKVKLVVRHLSDGTLMGGYVRELDLPFVPSIGMRFKQGASTWLWETEAGKLAPPVEQVIYDIDEETIVCLFTVDAALKSAFWETLNYAKYGDGCAELVYFQRRS